MNAREIFDGFMSMISGINAGGSKNSGNTYVFTPASEYEITSAYRQGWFRKIVDIPAEDMTREWREWQAEKDQVEAIEETEKRLDLVRKVRQAIVLARLYGGSALLVGTKGDALTELKPETIGKDGLDFVHAIGRFEFSRLGTSEKDGESQIIRDPLSPYFGQPLYYEIPSVNGKPGRKIHASRVIKFSGAFVPFLAAGQAAYGSTDGRVLSGAGTADATGWGDSLWEACKQAVMNTDLTANGIAELVSEAKVDVVKIKGFMSMIAQKAYETQQINRWTAAANLKSMRNILLLDADDEWQQKQISFDGLPDVLKLYLMMMAGVADIPATRLLGKSPDGQNSTGESDLRNYYDSLKSKQNVDLRATLYALDEMVIRSALGDRPDEVYYDWSPLWQPTATEKATIDKTVAETIKTYADTGVIPPPALAKGAQGRLIEDAVLPGLEDALAEAETAGEVAPIEEALSPEEQLQAEGDLAERTINAQAKAKPALRVVGKDGITITVTDATPRTLYVRRDVLNGEEILRWARGQGFTDLYEADDLHVTLIYSREPIDWLKIGEAGEWSADQSGRITVKPGGPRVVEKMGNVTAALLFSSNVLQWRHQSMEYAGAKHDFEDYQPHISLTKGATPDLSRVEPYRGKIVLGPEIFEELRE